MKNMFVIFAKVKINGERNLIKFSKAKTLQRGGNFEVNNYATIFGLASDNVKLGKFIRLNFPLHSPHPRSVGGEKDTVRDDALEAIDTQLALRVGVSMVSNTLINIVGIIMKGRLKIAVQKIKKSLVLLEKATLTHR